MSPVRVSFVQLSGFRLSWRRLKLNDDDLRSLEETIQVGPTRPPVIRGTNGLRKVRFASGSSSSGKSGGLRVCYAYFEEFSLVYLCAVYSKSERANLTAAERAEYGRILEEFRRYLRANWRQGWTP